ncbi:MAG: ACP S-malonyltransferase, partial [Pseudomonadota bacterium]
EVANDNDPGQVVISGHKAAIERAIGLVKDHGIKRGILLPVSAPFHCSLMQPAADRMAEALAETPPSGLALPLYANVTAGKISDPEEERELLVKQVTGRVRWRESVAAMHADGVASFVELGGKVLTPMIRKIAGDAETASLITMEEMEAFASSL